MNSKCAECEQRSTLKTASMVGEGRAGAEALLEFLILVLNSFICFFLSGKTFSPRYCWFVNDRLIKYKSYGNKSFIYEGFSLSLSH